MTAKADRPDPVRLPARYYALLVEMIRASDASIVAVLERVGIDFASCSHADATLSLAEMEILVAAALAATEREDLGFHLGRLIKPSNHEFLGYALMTSATLDEALHLAARYWRLITPTFDLRHTRDAQGVCIDLHPALPMQPPTMRFHVETLATAFHEEIRFLLGGKAPAYDLYLPQSLAAASRRYRELAPVRAHFVLRDAPAIRIVLPTAVTSQSLALADRNALKLARLRCDEVLARMTKSGSLAQWTQAMLAQASDHQPRQDELARMLHMSTRTMNRRLAEEGTGFRELGKQARHARACRLLEEGTTSITQIALQLGYRDVSNFTRAFRRAQGCSALEYRTRQASDRP